MKRFHVHVAVDQLEDSVRFYSALFGQPPTVAHADYAKWMLEDPLLNFAISQRGRQAGINHIGFQVETAEELDTLRTQLDAASAQVIEQKAITCCYTQSDKHWVTDPSGIAWETFRSLADAMMYGDETPANQGSSGETIAAAAQTCCAPANVPAATERRMCCS